MNVLIIGASRGVGLLAVQQALAAGHRVTAFARSPATTPAGSRLTWISGDALNPADIDAAMAGQEAVISTLGTDNRRGPTQLYSAATHNIVRAMDAAGVHRLIVLSNFGVLAERSCHPLTGLMALGVQLGIRDTLADHGRALDQLRRSSLDWTAIRPMALTDGAHTGIYRVAREGLPAGGTRISRPDVADFMVKQLASPAFLGQAPALAY